MAVPAASLYTRTGQRKYLNDAERRRFMTAARAAPAEVRTFCLTLAYSGCRISEALSLTVDSVAIEAGHVAILSLKKRGHLVVREIPLPPWLVEELARVHRLAARQSLATSDELIWPWGRTSAWRLVKQVMTAAQVRSLPATAKGLRHGFAIHAVLSGVPLTLIQKWLGHADIATTAIYANVLGPEERTIAARMW